MKYKSIPAFPVEVSMDGDGKINGMQTGPSSGFELGLTKREYFAGLAMQGYLASYAGIADSPHPETLAKKAVQFADALIAELEK